MTVKVPNVDDDVSLSFSRWLCCYFNFMLNMLMMMYQSCTDWSCCISVILIDVDAENDDDDVIPAPCCEWWWWCHSNSMLWMTMMILFQFHDVNDDVIDDEKNFWWFIDVPFSVPDANDVVSLSLSLSPDDVVEYPSCCVEIL